MFVLVFSALAFAQEEQRHAGTTIRMVGLRDISHEVALQDLKEFEERTGIKVEVNLLELDEMVQAEKMDFMAEAGTYDVITVDQPSLGEYVLSGWLWPLTEFLENPDLPDVQIGDIIPAILNGCTWENTIYAIPMGSYGNLFGYRTDLFEEAGIQKPPETWEEFLEYAQKLTKGDVYGTILYAKRGEYLSYDVGSYLWSFGSGYISDDKKVLFNNKEGIEALTFYSDLLLKYKVAPISCLNYGHAEFTQAMAGGVAAMALMIQESIGEPMEDPKTSNVVGKMAYSVIPGKELPDGTIRKVPHIGSHNLAISKYSRNKEAAFLLIQFLTAKERGLQYMMAGGKPFRFSHFEYPEVVEKYPYLKASSESLPIGRMRPNIPEYPAVSELFSTAFHKVLSGQATLEPAINQAALEATEILRKAYPEAYE